jgi:hypothetical protein
LLFIYISNGSRPKSRIFRLSKVFCYWHIRMQHEIDTQYASEKLMLSAW